MIVRPSASWNAIRVSRDRKRAPVLVTWSGIVMKTKVSGCRVVVRLERRVCKSRSPGAVEGVIAGKEAGEVISCFAWCRDNCCCCCS